MKKDSTKTGIKTRATTKKGILIIFSLIIILIAIILSDKLFSDTPDDNLSDEIPEESYCKQDSDCIPAECCHPTSCINRDFKQECKDTFCTAVCTDCISCSCIANTCTASAEKTVEDGGCC